MADHVRVKVKVRVGSHLTRESFDAHGASVDPVGADGAVLTLFDAHDRPTTTILWPANVVKVVLTREYEGPPLAVSSPKQPAASEIPTEALEAAAAEIRRVREGDCRDQHAICQPCEPCAVAYVRAVAPYLIAYGVRKAAVQISVRLEDLPLDDHSATYIRLDYAIDTCRAISEEAGRG